jgi:hypothetical protein
MGAFNINITGVGGHGCERKAKAGEKLFGRCGRFTCPDCLAYEFVQRLRQAGMVREGDTAYGQELKDGEPVPDGAEVYYTNAEHRLVDGPVEGGRRFFRFLHKAEFTHWPYTASAVVDDMLKNERKSGQF